MTFGELITKQLFGEFEVYIDTDSLTLSDPKVKLFSSFDFDPDKEETVKEYKENIRLFWDYDVKWFEPKGYQKEDGSMKYYIKILIKKPQKDEELPF